MFEDAVTATERWRVEAFSVPHARQAETLVQARRTALRGVKRKAEANSGKRLGGKRRARRVLPGKRQGKTKGW